MRQIALHIGFALLLTASASANPATCWLKGDMDCRINVGKRVWVLIPKGNPNVVEVTFTQGDWTTARTLKLITGASFQVMGIVQTKEYWVDYVVKLDDGRKGWVGVSSPFLVGYDPIARAKANIEECQRRGQPKIGMTAEQLTSSCWGRPARIIKKTTAIGIEEDYVYGIGHIVRFRDGVVTEIVEAR
jgi:hypothetical protein